MMIDRERWEHGSEMHWLDFVPSQPEPSPWNSDCSFYGSGRDALLSLIESGYRTRNWRRLLVPSYFCQEVLATLKTTSITIEAYPAGPAYPGMTHAGITEDIRWRKGDVLLRVNFFGLEINQLSEPMPDWVEVIEDHTHDPWSRWAFESSADWCIASLRKTLPLGNGGSIWSPCGHALPFIPAVTLERHVAALEKLVASILKSHYLMGHLIEKDVFRELQLLGEKHIASGDVSGMPRWAESLLRTFPITQWRERRRKNHSTLKSSLSGVPWLEVLQSQHEFDSTPYAGILVFDTPYRREMVRERLISARIYPAILWSLEEAVISGIRNEDLGFSRRMLAIHCDARYTDSDMCKVAELILQFGEMAN